MQKKQKTKKRTKNRPAKNKNDLTRSRRSGRVPDCLSTNYLQFKKVVAGYRPLKKSCGLDSKTHSSTMMKLPPNTAENPENSLDGILRYH
jgi:hypothetical protein